SGAQARVTPTAQSTRPMTNQLRDANNGVRLLNRILGSCVCAGPHNDSCASRAPNAREAREAARAGASWAADSRGDLRVPSRIPRCTSLVCGDNARSNPCVALALAYRLIDCDVAAAALTANHKAIRKPERSDPTGFCARV